uniref:AbrB/MazE/SpoVT family DNA-binding domain-containing protein n=1 Tax=Listeria monocytogenes TaxID=1639 RepID=UPI003132EBFB
MYILRAIIRVLKEVRLMTTVSVKKWGNSKAVRLPNNLLNALDIKENDDLQVEVINNQMI